MFQDFQTPSYAGFWIRFAAYLIDTIIMMLVLVPVGAVIGVLAAATSDGDLENSPMWPLATLVIRVVSVALGWLYYALMESSSWQATVGKKALGLRVTDMDGNRIGFGRATGRYFGKILSGMICLIGFIMAAFTERRQALHDMMASTLVLKGGAVASYPEPPPPPDFGYTGGTVNWR
jgi:uncharacterized RDD family membrane protein YckC